MLGLSRSNLCNLTFSWLQLNGWTSDKVGCMGDYRIRVLQKRCPNLWQLSVRVFLRETSKVSSSARLLKDIGHEIVPICLWWSIDALEGVIDGFPCRKGRPSVQVEWGHTSLSIAVNANMGQGRTLRRGNHIGCQKGTLCISLGIQFICRRIISPTSSYNLNLQ